MKRLYPFIILYTVVLSLFSIARYNSGLFPLYDLHIFEQSLSNIPLLYNNIENMSHFGVHTSPILYTVVPFYLLIPHPYTLLVIQSFIIAIAAIPLYYLAFEIIKDKLPSLIISLLYLSYPLLHGANLFDFHEVVFLPLILFTALYFLVKHNTLYFVILLSLALLVKEDVPFITIPLLIYAFYKYTDDKDRKLIILGIIIAAAWLVASIFVIIPYFNPNGVLMHTSRFSSVIFNIDQLGYVVWILFPLLFIPLFAPIEMLVIIPGLAFLLLQSDSFRYTTYTHYILQFIPILFFAFIIVINRITDRKPIIYGIFIILFLISVLQSPLSPISQDFASFIFL